MKLEFLKSMTLGVHHFDAGECIELNEQDPTLRELNEEYYILIFKGIRFDLHKGNVKVTEE